MFSFSSLDAFRRGAKAIPLLLDAFSQWRKTKKTEDQNGGGELTLLHFDIYYFQLGWFRLDFGFSPRWNPLRWRGENSLSKCCLPIELKSPPRWSVFFLVFDKRLMPCHYCHSKKSRPSLCIFYRLEVGFFASISVGNPLDPDVAWIIQKSLKCNYHLPTYFQLNSFTSKRMKSRNRMINYYVSQRSSDRPSQSTLNLLTG